MSSRYDNGLYTGVSNTAHHPLGLVATRTETSQRRSSNAPYIVTCIAVLYYSGDSSIIQCAVYAGYDKEKGYGLSTSNYVVIYMETVAQMAELGVSSETVR